jgi:hypothetical protein
MRASIDPGKASRTCFGMRRAFMGAAQAWLCGSRSTVAKYIGQERRPVGSKWGAFLRNHMPLYRCTDLLPMGFNLL